jgi:hypothetical protein
LSAVRRSAAENGVAVEYEEIEEPSPSPDELMLTERLLTIGRKPDTELPERTVIEDDTPDDTPSD